MTDTIDPRDVEDLDLNGNPVPKKKKSAKKTAKKTKGKAPAARVEDIMKKKAVRKIEEYYYFSQQELSAAKIRDAVPEDFKDAADIWPDLDLVEVVMRYDSLIFQNARDCFIDPEDQKYFEEHGIRSWYQISFDSADISMVRDVMRAVLATCGGMIGSDTDDFEPSFTADTISGLT